MGWTNVLRTRVLTNETKILKTITLRDVVQGEYRYHSFKTTELPFNRNLFVQLIIKWRSFRSAFDILH